MKITTLFSRSSKSRTGKARGAACAALCVIAVVAVSALIMLGGKTSARNGSLVASAGSPDQPAATAAPHNPIPVPPDKIATPPDRPVTASTLAIPACIPVVDHTGAVRGCVKREDEYPSDPKQYSAVHTVGAKVPVYDNAGNVVGYFVTGSVGFVDKATGGDPATLADVQQCFDAGLQDAPVTQHCADVLHARGVKPIVEPAR